MLAFDAVDPADYPNEGRSNRWRSDENTSRGVINYQDNAMWRNVMRKSLLGLALAAGLPTLLFATVGTASADPYKWCANYSGSDAAATNCGFVTIEQCQATISGVGGTCGLNQFYTGPDERHAKRGRHTNSRK
jgi:hypothetical protein